MGKRYRNTQLLRVDDDGVTAQRPTPQVTQGAQPTPQNPSSGASHSITCPTLSMMLNAQQGWGPNASLLLCITPCLFHVPILTVLRSKKKRKKKKEKKINSWADLFRCWSPNRISAAPSRLRNPTSPSLGGLLAPAQPQTKSSRLSRLPQAAHTLETAAKPLWAQPGGGGHRGDPHTHPPPSHCAAGAVLAAPGLHQGQREGAGLCLFTPCCAPSRQWSCGWRGQGTPPAQWVLGDGARSALAAH